VGNRKITLDEHHGIPLFARLSTNKNDRIITYHTLLIKPIIRTNKMKFLIAALSISQAFAFSVIGANSRPISTQLHAAADYVPKEGEGKINLLVGIIYRLPSPLYLLQSNLMKLIFSPSFHSII
jgi:hypothetical protein